jgi:3-oxoacyl-[acyl-carrier protein] reductase
MMKQPKVVIITGAGGGIGREIVKSFLTEDNLVIAADLKKELIEKTISKELLQNKSLVLESLDMANSGDIKQFSKRVLESFGRVDVLVNNAGINKRTKIDEISPEEWDYVMNVNLRGPFELSQSFLNTFRAQNSGRIVNTSSSAGKMGGLIVGAHYSVSKAGLICLTKVLAQHLAAYNVTVNAVCPGPTDTEFHAETSPEQKAKIRNNVPLKRFGKPADIAAAIVFLASEGAAWITGEILDVNGGIFMD